MLLGFAQLILFGLLVEALARRARLPGLLGLLFLGMMLGPYGTGWLASGILAVSPDLRRLALVIILLRAGLEVSREALQKVGGRAVLMAFIPCVFEIATVTLVGPHFLAISSLEAAILGSVLAAVSPAVVVPFMVQYIREGRGARRGVPTLVLAGASLDDAVAILICTSLVALYVGSGEGYSLLRSMELPLSVLTGIGVGLGVGWLWCRLAPESAGKGPRSLLALLGLAMAFAVAESLLSEIFPFAGLLAIMAMGFAVLALRPQAAAALSWGLGHIWVFAALLLFGLVGAEVNLALAWEAGFAGIAVIALGLLGRSLGVQLLLLGSIFTARERLFAMIAYLPKATVQAAIGGVPLLAMSAAGKPTGPGELILAIAVASIVLTAPLGAVLLSWAGKNLLECD